MSDSGNDTREFKKGELFTMYLRHAGAVRKIHIVEVIDEGKSFCPLVVYRYFGVHKRWWHYCIEDAYSLTGQMELSKQLYPEKYKEHVV